MKKFDLALLSSSSPAASVGEVADRLAWRECGLIALTDLWWADRSEGVFV